MKYIWFRVKGSKWHRGIVLNQSASTLCRLGFSSSDIEMTEQRPVENLCKTCAKKEDQSNT